MSPTVLGVAATTITATPKPSTSSVTLVIGLSSPVTKVLRSNANGIAEVRTMENQLPTVSYGQLILEDYEAAAGTNTYTVVDGREGATASATLTLTNPWFMVPVMPNYAGQIKAITSYNSARESHSTTHRVIGRADPLVSFGRLGTRTGTMEVYCSTLKEARSLEGVMDRGEIVMLKQNVSGMDMYFYGSSTGISPYAVAGETDTRYALTVNFTEVKRPTGPLAGALGWTFTALAAAYPTFNEVSAKFDTFDDLTLRAENDGTN